MKLLAILLICIMILPGCAYYKNTLVRIKADNVDIEASGGDIPKISAERLNGIINRQVYLGGDEVIPELHNIELSEVAGDTDDKVSITK